MQHIVHIFIGEELVTFRNHFASTFRRLHADLDKSLFAAISLTSDCDKRYNMTPDDDGDALDRITIDKDNRQTLLFNYFEDMYGRKVTVANSGNQSMIIMLWVNLFLDSQFEIIKDIIDSILCCNSNIRVELAGFTHDAVSCFVTNPHDRLSPDIYKSHFDHNITLLRQIRPHLAALRLITNRNLDNVSLNLTEETMARVCAEFSALMCEHYLSIHPTVIDSQEYPFETFGISALIFDLEYYKTYIRNRILIDKSLEQGIDNRIYNLNALAQRTNPIVIDTLDEIHNFSRKQVTHAAASLSLGGNVTASQIVGTIDHSIKDITHKFSDKIHKLLTSGKITIFESEALLSLILGDDCPMFDSSAVDAEEKTIDDIIDESAGFFTELDDDKSRFNKVSQQHLKEVRTCMRNITAANRQREERLVSLNIHTEEAELNQQHIIGNEYRFGDTNYKLDLNIDSDALEQIYEPHDVMAESIDLRDRFAPIRNQGQQGSCASFAIASVIEALRHDKKRYSPAFLYWTARESNAATDSDSGATLYDVIKAAMQKGACTEDMMPYSPAIFSIAPSDAALNEANKCRVLEAKTVEPNIKDIKSALSDGYPVIIASKIFDSFSDTISGFVRHPTHTELSKGERTDGHGNHAMVVCGFSDKERVFVVRNSWGTDFGDNGYCYIPYSYARQYFRQACIITKVSSTEKELMLEQNRKTINFNISDRNIEAAILQNLIHEDNCELAELAEKYALLRTDWAQNIATLGNVNNQTELIRKYEEEVDDKITELNRQIASRQSTKNNKLKNFKREHIQSYISIGAFLLSWIMVLFFQEQIWPWIVAGSATFIFLCVISVYGFRWRKFRQDLRDEIQNLALRISTLQEQKTNIGIQAHIHGTILREMGKYRDGLQSQYQILKHFNSSWIDMYNEIKMGQRLMTPSVPYPFLAVLDNDSLDRYYLIWRNKMLNSLDLKSIFAEFSDKHDINLIIKNNSSLTNTIVRGLKGFSMKEYVNRQDSGKWQFLPDSAKISEVIPNLDSRAKPFCPYNSQIDNTLEKFIFIKDITQEDMKGIIPYFSQAPRPIRANNPYSICIVNIIRYNLR